MDRAKDSRALTRREAIAAAALAVVGSAAGRLSPALGEDSPKSGPYGPFKMGLQSYSLRHFSREEALALTKQLGLHYWESYPAHVPPEPEKADQYRQQAADQDVRIVGFGVVRFSKDHEANRKTFTFAKALGIEYLSADPDPDAFDSLDKLVEEFGIPVGIHNHGPGHRYDTIEAIQKAIKDHHRLIGCCLDTGHFLRSKVDPVDVVEAFNDRIYGVHIKDVKDAKTYTVLGRGDLRTADFLKALAQRNYSHCLALEYEENPQEPMAEIRECLAAIRQAIPKS